MIKVLCLNFNLFLFRCCLLLFVSKKIYLQKHLRGGGREDPNYCWWSRSHLRTFALLLHRNSCHLRQLEGSILIGLVQPLGTLPGQDCDYGHPHSIRQEWLHRQGSDEVEMAACSHSWWRHERSHCLRHGDALWWSPHVHLLRRHHCRHICYNHRKWYFMQDIDIVFRLETFPAWPRERY